MDPYRLNLSFYKRDVLEVAPALLGKSIIRKHGDGGFSSYIITETEAYKGTEDKACHASKGKTPRTEVMFEEGGLLYMYLIYGMYWMMNVVTGPEEDPQAVLIRGVKGYDGPGKLSRGLELDGSFNRENLLKSSRIYIADSKDKVEYSTHPRIGIDYAGEYWRDIPWRFVLRNI